MPKPNPQAITLELGKTQIPLRRFREAVAAFFELIESVSREVATGDPIKWTISVQKGSALVVATPDPKHERTDEVLRIVPAGIAKLEGGNLDTLPDKFSEKAVRAARKLSVFRDRGENTIPISLAIGDHRTPITSKTAATADDLVEAAYQSYGSVEGKLLMLSDEDGFKFAVSQPLFNRRVICFVHEEMIPKAIAAFRKRVRVSGRMQYNRAGNPVSVQVESIFQFPQNSDLPSVAEMKGILATA